MKERRYLLAWCLGLFAALLLSATRVASLWMEWAVVLILASLAALHLPVRTKVAAASVAIAAAWSVTFSWVPAAIVNFGSLNGKGALMATFVLVLVQTLPLMLVVLIAHHFRRRREFPIFFAVFYAVAESAWPWLAPYSCAVSTLDTPLVVALPWIGRGGIALIMAFMAARLVRRNHSARSSFIASAIFIVPALVPLGPSSESRSAEWLNAAVVQVNPSVIDIRESPNQVTSDYLRLSRSLLVVNRNLPTIVFWGESASPFMGNQQWHEHRVETSLPTRASLVFGASVLDEGAKVPTNSVLAAGSCSECRYDKQLLVPFAESVPALFNGWKRQGLHVFKSAHRSRPIRVQGTSIGTPICYEAMFPRSLSRLSEGGAQMIFNPVNDIWVPDVNARQAHRDLARLAAAEAAIPTLRLVNGGVSEVWDAEARVVAAIPTGVLGALPMRVPLGGGKDNRAKVRYAVELAIMGAAIAIVLITLRAWLLDRESVVAHHGIRWRSHHAV